MLAAVLAGEVLCAGTAAAGTPEVDVMLLTTTLSTSTPMNVVPPGILSLSFPATVNYTFAGGVRSGCLTALQVAPLPPVTVPVSFVEAPTAEYGACTGLTGSGTFSYEACGTGIASGSASFTEPAGELVTIANYSIVFLSGVGLFAAAPLTGGGYTDDAATGAVVGVALLVPLTTPST
jgi:hypothetical protein